MKVLVFGKTYSTARLYLINIIDNLKRKDIENMYQSMNEIYVKLTNGDIYQALSLSENKRGYKCDKVYVNTEVDQNVIDHIIKPMLCMSKLPVEEQIVIY